MRARFTFLATTVILGGLLLANEGEAQAQRKNPRKPRKQYTLRVAPGIGFDWQGQSAVTPTFILDAGIGYRFGVASFTSLWTEAGYTYAYHGATHLGSIGIGPLFGTNETSFGFVPKLIMGASEGSFAIGARNSVVLLLMRGGLGFEAGHQLFYNTGTGATQNEIRALVSVDPIELILRHTRM